MVQYTIFNTVLLYLLFICLYEHQQETKVSFLAIFGTFSRNSSEINIKNGKTSILLNVTSNISASHTGSNLLYPRVCSESILLAAVF